MDWQGTNSKVDDESDYLTIRESHAGGLTGDTHQ